MLIASKNGYNWLGAGFYFICIRNPNCIKGFFIPRDEITWKD